MHTFGWKDLEVTNDNKLVVIGAPNMLRLIFAGEVSLETATGLILVGSVFGFDVFSKGDHYNTMWSSIYVPAWGVPVTATDKGPVFTNKGIEFRFIYSTLTGERLPNIQVRAGDFVLIFNIPVLEWNEPDPPQSLVGKKLTRPPHPKAMPKAKAKLGNKSSACRPSRKHDVEKENLLAEGVADAPRDTAAEDPQDFDKRRARHLLR